jgi:hypothetical protein
MQISCTIWDKYLLRRVSLLTLPETLSSIPVFSGVRVSRSLALCVCFIDRSLSFCTIVLAIVLSVFLRYTDSDCPFRVFRLFMYI